MTPNVFYHDNRKWQFQYAHLGQKKKAQERGERLLNRRQVKGEGYNALLTQYTIERFLYRLSKSKCPGRTTKLSQTFATAPVLDATEHPESNQNSNRYWLMTARVQPLRE